MGVSGRRRTRQDPGRWADPRKHIVIVGARPETVEWERYRLGWVRFRPSAMVVVNPTPEVSKES